MSPKSHRPLVSLCLLLGLLLAAAPTAFADAAAPAELPAPAESLLAELDPAPAFTPADEGAATLPVLLPEAAPVSGCGFPPPRPPAGCTCDYCCECSRCWQGGQLFKCTGW